MSDSIQPTTVFLVLGLAFGLPLVVLTPPFQVPDEYEHFYRAVHVSQGHLVAEKRGDRLGGELPKSIGRTGALVARGLAFNPEVKQDPGEILKQLGMPLENDRRTFYDFPNIGLYSPVPYLAQAVGVSTARRLGGSPLVLMYAGRLFNLVLWIVLVWAAIRIAPIFRWVLLLVALTPMSLFMAASLSADAPTNALGLVWIALVLRTAVTRDRLSVFRVVVLLVVSSLLTLTKHAYLPMALMAFAIPAESFERRSHRALFLGTLFALNVAIFGGWSLVIRDWFVVSNPGQANISLEGQLSYVLGHPLEYAGIVFRTLRQELPVYGQQFIGVLGWLDTPLPSGLTRAYGAVLFSVCLLDARKPFVLTGMQRIVLGFTFVACLLSILTGTYMKWNSVGQPFVSGLQGRYFLPFAPLFCLLLYNTRLGLELHASKVKWLVAGFAAYAASHAMWVLLHRYYVSG